MACALSQPQQIAAVAIAASVGGLEALGEVFQGLPEGFPVPILVVQHADPRHASVRAQILQQQSTLRVEEARHKQRIEPAHIYLAPPDRHLLVGDDGTLCLANSSLVSFVRPSADLMFCSVAAHYRQRAVAVILAGAGSDGALGITAIKQMGGTTITQNELTSEVFEMPLAAIKTGCVDFVLPLNEITPALVTLVTDENAWLKAAANPNARS